MPKLTTFSYYGGKLSLLDFILPQLNTPHHTFVELCGGSAVVLLNKPKSQVEVLNDLSDDIITFWRVLRDRKDELLHAIANTPAGEAEFKYILNAPPSTDELETARRFFTHITQVFGGMPSHKHHSMSRGGFRFHDAQCGLPDVADRLRQVIIENTTATRLITRLINARNWKAKGESVLFYADPPYTADSRKSVDSYLHDDFNHDEFLDAVINAPASCKFCISGYPNPLYDERLTDWYRVEKKVLVSVANGASGSDRKRTEVLWRNYDVVNKQTELAL